MIISLMNFSFMSFKRLLMWFNWFRIQNKHHTCMNLTCGIYLWAKLTRKQRVYEYLIIRMNLNANFAHFYYRVWISPRSKNWKWFKTIVSTCGCFSSLFQHFSIWLEHCSIWLKYFSVSWRKKKDGRTFSPFTCGFFTTLQHTTIFCF